MASPEPSAAGAGAGGESSSQAAAVEPIRMPTAEEIKGQDIWNNCAVRSVVSGVMGGPKATCIGCAGFAAFSVAIEKFFDRHT
nr:unnamed protein product [Digitaria exilis]